MWSNVVEETGEPGENHRTWTGDHYPATCLDPDSNPDRSGDKRVRYPLRYPGPRLDSLEETTEILQTNYLKISEKITSLYSNNIKVLNSLKQLSDRVENTEKMNKQNITMLFEKN